MAFTVILVILLNIWSNLAKGTVISIKKLYLCLFSSSAIVVIIVSGTLKETELAKFGNFGNLIAFFHCFLSIFSNVSKFSS